jgi:hypothetical protein
MGIVETIKKGFGIVHKNMPLLLILFAFNLVSTLARLPLGQPAVAGQLSPGGMILGIIFGLIGILVFGGTLGSIKDYIQTQKVTLNNFIPYGTKYYVRILAIWILVALIVMAFVVLTAFAITVGIVTRNLVGVTLAVAVALIIGAVGIYVFILLLLAPYIVVADDTGPIVAIKRSITFVRNAVLKVVGLFVLLLLISVGIGFLIGILAGLIALVIRGGVGQVVISILASGFNAYINVLMPSCFLLIYLSSRKPEQPAAAPAPEAPQAPTS